jgi:hypothetical protein
MNHVQSISLKSIKIYFRKLNVTNFLVILYLFQTKEVKNLNNKQIEKDDKSSKKHLLNLCYIILIFSS